MRKSRIHQLFLLMWKNWLLKKNSAWITLSEALVPIFFIIFIILKRSFDKLEYLPNPKPTGERPGYMGHVVIGYAPACPATDKFMSHVETLLWRKKKFDAVSSFQVLGFKSEYSLMAFARRHPAFLRFVYAFGNMTSSSKKLPDQLHIISRPRNQDYNILSQFHVNGTDDYLLYVIMEAFINHATGQNHNITVNTKTFVSKSGNYADTFLNRHSFALMLVMLLFPLYLGVRNVYVMAKERESGVLVLLGQIGMSSTVYWVSWYLTVFLSLQLVWCAFVLVLLIPINKQPPIISDSNWVLIVIYFIIYTLSFTSYCIFGSVVHEKAKTTSALTVFLYLFSWISMNLLDPPYFYREAALIFFLDCNLYSFLRILVHLEDDDIGYQWSSWNKNIPSDYPSLSTIVWSLFFSNIVYIFGAFVFYNIRIMGRPLSYILPRQCQSSTKEWKECDLTIKDEYPSNLFLGIQIKDLHKTSQVRIAEITLDMFEDQITVLTGYELSGKSALMSVLQGEIHSITGSVEIYGYNILNNMSEIRRMSGICPRQEGVFFHSLTVKENLLFFYKLKDYLHDKPEKGDKTMAVSSVVEKFQLTEFLNEPCDTLKPTVMRVLQVAMSYIGNNKIILIEHPTTNMDLRSKSLVRKVLRKLMKHRTTVIETEDFEDAEMLGDRIAIFSSGRIICCGSYEFLKDVFGSGYYLKIIKGDSCISSPIKHVVYSCVREAALLEDKDTYLVFLLPMHSTRSFAKLFSCLDTNKQSLKIASYNVEASTLEEGVLGLSHTNPLRRPSETGHHKSADMTHKKATLSPKLIHGEMRNVSMTTKLSDIVNSRRSQVPSKRTSRIDVTGSPIDDPTSPKPSHGNSRIPPISLCEQECMNRLAGWTLSWSQVKAILKKKVIISTCTLHIELIQAMVICLLAFWLCNPDEVIDIARCQVGEKEFHPAVAHPLRVDVLLSEASMKNNLTKGIARTYEKVLSKRTWEYRVRSFVDIKEENKKSYVLENVTKKDIYYLYGASFYPSDNSSSLRATAWYKPSLKWPFLKPISITAVMNAFLYYLTKSQRYFIYASLVYQHESELDYCTIKQEIKWHASRWAHYASMTMAVVVLMVPYFTVLERKSGSLHLQYLSGVSPMIFWSVSLLYDLLTYFLMFNLHFLAVLGLAGRDVHDHFVIIYTITTLNGVMMLLYIYVVQNLFYLPSTAAAVIMFTNYFLAEAYSLVNIFEQGLFSAPEQEFYTLNYLLLFPSHVYPHTIYSLMKYARINDLCGTYLEHCHDSTHSNYKAVCCEDHCDELTNCHGYLNSPTTIGILALVIHLVFWLIMLILTECRYCYGFQHHVQRFSHILWKRLKKPYERLFRKTPAKDKQEGHPVQETLSTSVHIENETVKLMANAHVFGLVNVDMSYQPGCSISSMTITVSKGEFFCFVGTDNSTASVMMSLLSGLEMPFSGHVVIKGQLSRPFYRTPLPIIGYCPHIDAHLSMMTGRETLDLHAQLRGLPQDTIQSVVEVFLNMFLLTHVADKAINKYSECKKKRLSIAVALLGNPEILLLNDPISKLDLISKDIFWKAMKKTSEKGQTVVMTCDNMEEIATHVSRIVVVVDGQIICQETPSVLREIYCNSYTLKAKIDATNKTMSTSNLIMCLRERFPSAVLFHDQRYISLHIPYKDDNLVDIFSTMESCKKHLKIADYTLNHTNLNHVLQALEQGHATEDKIEDFDEDDETFEDTEEEDKN